MIFLSFYPDLLHILSYMPKDLNFVNHSSYIGWREYDDLSLKFYTFVFNAIGLYLCRNICE